VEEVRPPVRGLAACGHGLMGRRGGRPGTAKLPETRYHQGFHSSPGAYGAALVPDSGQIGKTG